MNRRSRIAVGAAAAVVAASLVGTAYWLGTRNEQPAAAAPAPTTSPSSSTSSTVTTPATSPTTSALPAPNDPVTAGVDWLITYEGRSWQQPAGQWVDAVAPYVTDQLEQQYVPDRDGSVGAAWPAFVTAHCTTVVQQAGGVIPDEAPRTDTTVYVQVSGSSVTTCTNGQPPPPATVPVAATLEVQRGTDGQWRVNDRMY